MERCTVGQINDQYRSYLWTDHVHAGMPSGIIQNGVRYCKRRPLIQVSNYIGSNVGSTFFIDLEWLRNANSNEINVSVQRPHFFFLHHFLFNVQESYRLLMEVVDFRVEEKLITHLYKLLRAFSRS